MAMHTGTERKPNRLSGETSPYLIQHQFNPVDWYPWGEEAMARARREDKPIFLSVGYSTCHWCHVMAHESFENAQIAELLNRDFVCVKVDREERPDIDRIYMAFVQATTGQGGWPMSVWLTPELKPFFGGTYFPPESRQGRSGFPDLLRRIAEVWRTQREEIERESQRIAEGLARHSAGAKADGGAPDRRVLERAFEYYGQAFDPVHGGFGGAPKFPRPSDLRFLLRFGAAAEPERRQQAYRMATHTLRMMARGGMHDHVGGGFHRYSVDESWQVPHFEKMLYDQAQLASAYLDGFQATEMPALGWAARDIFEYALRDLQAPEGGFYSAEDADSRVSHQSEETAEGAFYVWTADELDRVLGEHAALFKEHFGVEEDGNVSAAVDPSGELRGKNVLIQRRALAESAERCGLAPEELNRRLMECLALLKEHRGGRARPHRDEKVITAWNGLMISALARGYQVFSAADSAFQEGFPASGLLQAAERTAEFLLRSLYDETAGVLYRSYRGHRSPARAGAADYAFLIQGLLDLYEAGFDTSWFERALHLQEEMNHAFYDADGGGYFESRADEPGVLVRMKEEYDGAEPAAGSVAALNLLRLSVVFEGTERGQSWREGALQTLGAARRQWELSPQALPQMLCAIDFATGPVAQVVVAGQRGAEATHQFLQAVHERFFFRKVLLLADGEAGQQWLASQVAYLKSLVPPQEGAAGYLCREFVCKRPATDLNGWREVLRGTEA